METCEECGRQNERVRLKKKYNKILCDTCYKTFNENPIKYIPPAGEVHKDIEGKIICHVCGRSYNKLGAHIVQKHKISVDKYKEVYELNRSQSLTSDPLIEVFRRNKNINNIGLYRITFKRGHTNSKKPRRLQAKKNRLGMKYEKEIKKIVY